MPRFNRWQCDYGTPPHDEAFACANHCGRLVCGYHGVRSLEDEDMLCPDCFETETRRLQKANYAA